jgi:NADH-quinone oxidoreductase subunit K
MLVLGPTLLIAALLFLIGLAIVVLRRELLFILMGIEVMFNGVALTAVAAGQHWHDVTGQVLVIFLMIVTGAELAVALMLVLLAYNRRKATLAEDLDNLADLHLEQQL